MPLVLCYSASAIVRGRETWQQRRAWSILLASGVSTLFVFGWLWEIAVVESDRFRQMLQSLS
jgi:hypothetical protein